MARKAKLPTVPKRKKADRTDQVKRTLWLPRGMAKRLRQLAIERDQEIGEILAGLFNDHLSRAYFVDPEAKTSLSVVADPDTTAEAAA